MGSTFREWVTTFRQLHEKAERGELPPEARASYASDRSDLLRALAVMQQLTVQPGQTPRRQARVSRAVQIEIDLPAGSAPGFTLDLSSGGFATLLTRPPPTNAEFSYRLHLPRGAPITGRTRIADVRPSQGGSHRVSAAFIDLTDIDRERIEDFVLSTALTRLAG